MVFWPPLSTIFVCPYPWYLDAPTHGILNPIPMLFWLAYLWCIELPIHGILNPLAMLFLFLPIVFWPHYPWYFKPSTHGILTPFPYFDFCPWCFWPTYPWYFVPPADLLIINEEGQNTVGVQFPYRGVGFQKGCSIYHGWKLTPGSKYHGSQNTICLLEL